MRSIYYDGDVSYQVSKAADNEALTGAGVDMLAADRVTFLVTALQGEAADFSIKAQQAAESDYSDAADLAGTAVTFSTDTSADGLGVLEIVNPQERYVRPVITVPDLAAATPVACVAIVYGKQYRPVTAPTYGEIHIAPAEGTA
jgi:hypothetical protein